MIDIIGVAFTVALVFWICRLVVVSVRLGRCLPDSPPSLSESREHATRAGFYRKVFQNGVDRVNAGEDLMKHSHQTVSPLMCFTSRDPSEASGPCVTAEDVKRKEAQNERMFRGWSGENPS